VTEASRIGTKTRLAAIWQLSLMRWRLFYREPGTMFWTFGFPMALSIVLGIAFRSQGPEPVICAVEAGPRAAHVQELLSHTDDVKKPDVLSHDDASAQLRAGKVSIVVVPPDESNGPPVYRFDPTRPESRLAHVVVDDVLQRGEGRKDAYAPKADLVQTPGSRYIDFLIPGLVGLGLMSSGLWGVGFSLADMRTRKLLKRFAATPMRRADLLISFLVVRALSLVVELPPLLIFARIAFKVQMQGSFLAFALTSVIGALSFAVLGLLLASRAENPQIVSGLINVVSFPMYLGSGVFFSTARYPEGIRKVIDVLPLTALIDAQREIMNEGASFSPLVLRALAILLAWGIGSFVLAIKLFRWR
jgi:ABC-type multidrug transport system permease subunit